MTKSRPEPVAAWGATFPPFLSLVACLSALGLMLGLSSVSVGAPPSNDHCEGALVIPNAGPFPYLTPVVDITEATVDGDPPPPTTCPAPFPSNASRSTWFVFQPSKSGNYLISACSDAPTATTVVDTIMAIYASANGCVGPLTEIVDGCSDDSCGPGTLQSSLLVRLERGTTYYAVVWQYDDAPPSPSYSSLQLAVRQSILPENDTCGDALPVVLNQPVTGSTVGANNDYELSDAACFAGIGQGPSAALGPDVVYSFTAPTADRYFIKAFNYSLLGDLVLYVAGSCPGRPFPAVVTDCLGAANRSPLSSAEAVVCLELAANQQVYIIVDDEIGGGAGSSFSLQVTRCVTEVEPNNVVNNANQVSIGLVGAIQNFGDVDFFALGAPPVGARLFAVVDGEAANLSDFDLRVVTQSNTLEYDDDNNDLNLGDTSPNLAGTILPGGPVYLRVNFNNFFTISEPYSLYAVVQPPLQEATEETEPNNLLGEAQTAENNYFFGRLDGPAPSRDADVFRFTADGGDLIYLGVDGDPLRDNTPIDAKLELLDEMGEVLAMVNDGGRESSSNHVLGGLGEFFPTSPGEALVCRAPGKGLYHARVSIGTASTGPEGAGDYLLSISRNCLAGSSGANRLPEIRNLYALSPIGKGEDTTLTAEVWDADLGQTHTVTVDWGDGSNQTIIPLWHGEGGFSVNHGYLEPPPEPDGHYVVSVTVTDNYGGANSTNAQVVVYPVRRVRFVSIQELPDGSMRLQLEGEPNSAYDIWVSGDLSAWSLLASRTSDAEGRFDFVDDTQPRPPVRFYRAVAP